jgi:hypothetical protein
MNNLRDDSSSEPRSTGGKSDKSGVEQPRKPRIEVLRSEPAAVSASDLAQSPNDTSIDVVGTGAPGASPARKSWIAPDVRQQAETSPERRRRPLFRSLARLLMLVAIMGIAALFLYTYLSSKRNAADYARERAEVSSADAEPLKYPEADADSATTQESTGPSAASSAPQRTAGPEARLSVAETSEVPSTAKTVALDNSRDALATVRAFYSALSGGDGAAAAQLVVPAKRQSGPLSAGPLSRYYSSFLRPLRVQSVTHVDTNTILVAYDYVLADGRVCRGRSVVDVVQRGDRSLVSRIRTQGAC